jgi:hypothetical protein
MSWCEPVRLPNGNLRVPMRAEGPGGLVGDAALEIGPDTPEFDRWLAVIQERERREADG